MWNYFLLGPLNPSVEPSILLPQFSFRTNQKVCHGSKFFLLKWTARSCGKLSAIWVLLGGVGMHREGPDDVTIEHPEKTRFALFQFFPFQQRVDDDFRRNRQAGEIPFE